MYLEISILSRKIAGTVEKGESLRRALKLIYSEGMMRRCATLNAAFTSRRATPNLHLWLWLRIINQRGVLPLPRAKGITPSRMRERKIGRDWVLSWSNYISRRASRNSESSSMIDGSSFLSISRIFHHLVETQRDARVSRNLCLARL